MKQDILVAYPTLPRQMAMLEDQYTLHRYDQLADDADREAFLHELGGRCVGMVTIGHCPLDRRFMENVQR